MGGHLAVLQWAREHGCEWNSNTCSAAAEGGHLEVLQWLREHGCEWNSNTCSAAAEGGHLEVLQNALSSGNARMADWVYAQLALQQLP